MAVVTDLHARSRLARGFAVGLLAAGVAFGCASSESGTGGAPGTGGHMDAGVGGGGGLGGAAGQGGQAGIGGAAGDGGAGGAGADGGAGGTPIINEKSIPIVCDTNFTHSWRLPAFESFASLEVFPSSIESGQGFSADVAATLRISKEVLQREVDGAFPDALTSIEITAAQAEVAIFGAAALTSTLTTSANLPRTIAIPQVPGACPPDACPNIVTEDVEIEVGILDNAQFSAQPGGNVCFDVDGDLELYRSPDSLRTSVRLVIGDRERRVECAGGVLNQNGTLDSPYDDWVDANPVGDQLCFPIECPDGECNVCPTIDSFTGGPREFVIASSVRPYPRAHLAFRAHDPDRSCGNACDPGYPESNIICTAIADGTPWESGRFFDPLDPSTAVGPWLTVNLDTLQPGIALPGLGGDEALPPLDFECPSGGIHHVSISLLCTDGDARCDQRREILVGCFHGDWCIDDPVDCSGSNDCMTDGVCDNGCPPQCDPDREGYDPADCDRVIGAPGSGTCSRCPGKDNPLPSGTPCASNGGTVCDGAGNCL